MVRADQGLKGRAAPKTKSRSSFSSRSNLSIGASTVAPLPTQLTKAAKRALKRTELVTQVKNKSGSILQLTPSTQTHLSKSALKRLKKKQKEQLAGNHQGLKDLQDVMDQFVVQQDDQLVLENEEQEQQDDDDDEEDDKEYGTEENLSKVGSRAARKKGGAVTEKSRKKALSTEMNRQSLILTDPAFAKNPFAALRTHAQNTLAFDRGSLSRAKAPIVMDS